jgi:hypothetical protein
MSTSDHIDTHREWASPFYIVDHPTLPAPEKRSLLASWASDIRAVPNYPSLRQLDDGRFVHIDDVLDALKRLDGGGPEPSRSERVEPRPARQGHWSRLSRIWRRRRDDDDDDPPPAVAADIPRSPIPNDGLTEAALAA